MSARRRIVLAITLDERYFVKAILKFCTTKKLFLDIRDKIAACISVAI